MREVLPVIFSGFRQQVGVFKSVLRVDLKVGALKMDAGVSVDDGFDNV